MSSCLDGVVSIQPHFGWAASFFSATSIVKLLGDGDTHGQVFRPLRHFDSYVAKEAMSIPYVAS